MPTSLQPSHLEAIVIGGSAGALDALDEILPALPPAFPLPIAIVLHIPPNRPSLLPEVLGARCVLPVREADDKEPLAPGTIHVAPPGYHMLIERTRTLALSVDEPVYFSRPAIDVLFDSAADAYGPALAGVLLSGASEDGARGLAQIVRAGGTTVVQAPETAAARVMPEAALRLAYPAHTLAPAEIGAFLAGLGRRATAIMEVR